MGVIKKYWVASLTVLCILWLLMRVVYLFAWGSEYTLSEKSKRIIIERESMQDNPIMETEEEALARIERQKVIVE